MEPELAPPPHLADHVEALWAYATGDRPVTRRVPPDGCLDLIVELDGAAVRTRVYGPTDRFDDVTLAPARRLVGLRFAAGVGPRVLGQRGDELAGQGCSLDDVAPEAAAILRGAARAEDVPGRLTAAAAALLARARPTALHRRVARAVAAFEAGAARVADVARDLAIGERTLHRDFLAVVGLPPRRFLRVARARRAAAAIARGQPLVDVAAACGYADQAHLTRELAELHGATPGRLRGHVRNVQDGARELR